MTQIASPNTEKQEKLTARIVRFSLPLMVSNLLQVLFNMADIAVIGKFAGSISLAAVGSTATAVTLFTGVLIGLGSGVNALIARYWGAKDNGTLRRVSGLREFLTTLSEHGADILPEHDCDEIVDRLGKVSMALAIQSLELRTVLRKSVEQRHLESGDVELF